jgi:hypothetical protein
VRSQKYFSVVQSIIGALFVSINPTPTFFYVFHIIIKATKVLLAIFRKFLSSLSRFEVFFRDDVTLLLALGVIKGEHDEECNMTSTSPRLIWRCCFAFRLQIHRGKENFVTFARPVL